jgi:hypothetical protein
MALKDSSISEDSKRILLKTLSDKELEAFNQGMTNLLIVFWRKYALALAR